MQHVIALQLVWLREVAHEAGTRFAVVAEPARPTEVDPATAARWVQLGWAEAVPARKRGSQAGEGA